jgi:hypothetical protein
MTTACPVCKNDENPKYDEHSDWCRICVAAELGDQQKADTRRQPRQYVSADGVQEK